ncbi:MAG TPA: hypothetical protein PKB11_02975 [Desulfovibrio sp.]|uniref:hypothetical protein n=1 Tax=Desulfovibrio TaxID=872 RepID=UPI002C0A44B3|nr:hypothetical protein [Desulfovibrio sp.]HMM37699.1 hypothetical protein [Desulfovibrio sp.]
MNPLRRFVVVVVVMTLLAPALALAQQTAPKAEQKAPEAQVEKKAEPKAEQKAEAKTEQKAEAKPEHKAGKAEHKAEKKQDPANKGRVPVVVDYEGEDALGQRLAFELREAFRASAGFRLTGTGDKGLRLRLRAVPEFKDRPGLGSIYAVSWLFSEGGNVLSYFLDSGLGVIDEGSLKREAQSLTARTDELSGRFAYLLSE